MLVVEGIRIAGVTRWTWCHHRGPFEREAGGRGSMLEKGDVLRETEAGAL